MKLRIRDILIYLLHTFQPSRLRSRLRKGGGPSLTVILVPWRADTWDRAEITPAGRAVARRWAGEVTSHSMLNAIRHFFDQHIGPKPEEPASAERRARLAAAVLLVEVARSDHDFSQDERQAVLRSVQDRFGLSAGEAGELVALAEAESREAHDIYQFTSKIDAGFSPDEKLRLLEELWRAAYADSVIHAHEEHLIRRVADMLHLSHSQFIAAKLRAVPNG